MTWWRTVALVRALDTEKPLGTAFYVGERRALTALHVVNNPKARQGIELVWWWWSDDGALLNDRASETPRMTKSASVIWPSVEADSQIKRLDVAVLEVETPPCSRLVLESAGHKRQDVTSSGFPVGADLAGVPAFINVSGGTFGCQGENDFQVDLGNRPESKQAWKGLSGGPVIAECDSRVLGVFTKVRGALDESKTLYATPIAYCMKDAAFNEALFGADPHPWRNHAVDQRSTDALAETLRDAIFSDVALLSDGAWTKLCDKFPAATAGVKAAQGAQILADAASTARTPQDAINIVAPLMAERLEDADKLALARIALSIASLRLPEDDELYVAWMRDSRGGVTLGAVSGLVTRAEVLASRIDVPDDPQPRFAPSPGSPMHMPRGRFKIPNPPEQGPDDDGVGELRALEDFLQSRVDPETFLSRVEGRLYEKVNETAPPVPFDDELRGALSDSLHEVRTYADGRRSYYWIAPAPERLAPAEQERLFWIAREFATRYPDTLTIALDPNLLREERRTYAGMINAARRTED